MKIGYSFGSLVSFVEALNAAAVKTTGDQTIAGLKTFSSNPITSAAQGSGGGYLTRKDYVDGALDLKAPLASPALTGVPTAPTAAAGTNTTQIATTAFVQSAAASAVTVKASSADPLMDGVATSGTSTNYAREGHIHPTDTSRAPLASPALTGIPTAPTATAGTNTTQLATTAFVTSANTAQLASAAPLMDGTAAVGISTLLARQDHIHPTDTSIVPAGAVFHFARATAPSGYLKCDGALVSRTTYAALFAAIGTTFGVGDGSTTFGLPDLRGEFIRGWDDGRGVDIERAMGNAQSGAVEYHNHTLPTGSGTGSNSSGIWGVVDQYWQETKSTNFETVANETAVSGSVGIAAYAGAIAGTFAGETRPRNIALLACIKY